MDDAHTDATARNRHFLIAANRLIGAALIVVGMLVLAERIDLPQAVGWVLIPLGMFDFFVFPLLLARRYRTPRK